MLSLKNLFGYVRDLYNTGEPIYLFDQEPNNAKLQNQHFFALHDWQQLLDTDALRNGDDAKLDWRGVPDEPFFRIKRITIPELPVPTSLVSWVALPKNPTEKPLAVTKIPLKTHRLVRFAFFEGH